MSNRFIYFKEEINILLNLVNDLPNNKKKSINLNKFKITIKEWYYLTKTRDILEIFRKPTIKFQTSSYSTISLIIPYITRLYFKIEDFITKETNPFIKVVLKDIAFYLV